jgi:hypothetical protein
MYDQGFCYPILHERISGKLAICRNKIQNRLEVFHILFTAVYFNGEQQQLNITIKTIIQISSRVIKND